MRSEKALVIRKVAGLLSLLALFAFSGVARATNKSGAPPWLQWDKGPDHIDVSAYPAEQKHNYKLFIHRCSACHSLARAINAPYSTLKGWKPVVSRMQKKPGAGLNEKSVKIILDFLAYESGVRKKGRGNNKRKSGRDARPRRQGSKVGQSGAAPIGISSAAATASGK